MTVPFTHNEFRKLCYLPYNTILTSFLAHVTPAGGIDWAGMRDEQAAEVEHREAKLKAHTELNQRDWEVFNSWVDCSERSFIHQLEEGVALGQLAPAKTPDDYEPIAWYICKLEAYQLGTWPPRPVRPHWLQKPTAIGIVVA